MSEAASAVRWLLHQAEPEARRVAVQQIAKVHGREATELLLRALGDEDWRVRKEAATVAPVLERRDEVVAVLVAALEETLNIGLRNAAVEALIAAGADFKARVDAGFDPLLFAVREGKRDTVEALLKAGVDVNDSIQPARRSSRAKAGTTALILATLNAHYELAAGRAEYSPIGTLALAFQMSCGAGRTNAGMTTAPIAQ